MSNLWLSPHAWDATRLSSLFKCRRRFKWEVVEPIVPAGEGGFPVHLEYGRLWHSSLRVYDEIRMTGAVGALTAALTHALLESNEWPQDTGSPAKTRETLIRNLIWYDDQFGGQNALAPLIADNVPAFELSFRFPLWPRSNTLLCGNLDGVVSFGDEIWVLERKSTEQGLSSYYWNQFNPNLQIDIYCLAAHLMWPEWRIQGVLVEACQTGVTFCRTQRRLFRKSPAQLEETLRAIQHEVNSFEGEYFDRSERTFRPNFTSCTSQGRCPFLSICQADPSVRDWELRTHWQPHPNPWNPLDAERSRLGTLKTED